MMTLIARPGCERGLGASNAAKKVLGGPVYLLALASHEEGRSAAVGQVHGGHAGRIHCKKHTSGMSGCIFTGRRQYAWKHSFRRAGNLPTQATEPNCAGNGFGRCAVVAHHAPADAERFCGAGQ